MPISFTILRQRLEARFSPLGEFLQGIDPCGCLGQQSVRALECFRSGCAHGRVLRREKFLCLYGPWHQLAIKTHPIRAQFIPETATIGGVPDAPEKLGLQSNVIEEATPSACIRGS